MTGPSLRSAAVPLVLAASLLIGACSADPRTPVAQSSGTATASAAGADTALQSQVAAVVTRFAAREHLRAALVRVTRGDDVLYEGALGESMTGVPATVDMHFRNGAVAISYISTALLTLVDQGTVSLDDTVSTWLPEITHSDEVTLRQLAQMTSGYVDYQSTAAMDASDYQNPFRQWTPQELLDLAVDQPLWYPPGTNWDYSHTNYVLLGLVLEKITGQPLEQVLQERVLDPLQLTGTSGNDGTPAIPEPALHAFTSERREALKIPADVPFYEDATFWNPSWTLARGAIQTTTLADLSTTARGLYSGRLLTPGSYQAFTTTELRGKTSAVPGCPACFEQNIGYTYGLGVVISGDWLLQDPLFAGESAVAAYLPSQDVSVAVAVTYAPEAFDPTTGDYDNAADQLWREVAAQVVPDDAPPIKNG